MHAWRWFPAALLLTMGGMDGRGDEVVIESFDPGGSLTFRALSSSMADHHYRIEETTSLVSSAWMPLRTTTDVWPATSVETELDMEHPAGFYRVVAVSNSAAFVDGSYLAIDISGGPSATNYPVATFPSAGDVPGGVTASVYKTSTLLLRRIPRGEFAMGSSRNELGRYGDELRHRVTLTADFHLGVFEVTQRQWELVVGTTPSYFNNPACYQTRPVERVTYYAIRENTNNSPISANWPATAAVHPDSFMGRLRAKTGLPGLDLPTEAQWEYACRAGTGAALNCGTNLTATDICPNMSAVGRYKYNGGSNNAQSADLTGGTSAAGSYQPNAWGLYDMHGNVWEWCLDRYGAYSAAAVDPRGELSVLQRVARGGSWAGNAYLNRSASRGNEAPDYVSNVRGFRLCCHATEGLVR